MYRLSLTALLLAAACGGSPKPTAPTSPLPDDKPATATTTPPATTPPPAPPAPPPPQVLDVTVPAVQTTVKLVSGGKGKKEAIRYAQKEGAKQSLEMAMDFTGQQDTQSQTLPTIVLNVNAETKAIKDGAAQYVLTVASTDARDTPGAVAQIDQLRGALGLLNGLQIGGTLSGTGTASDVSLHMDAAPPHAKEILDLVRLTLPHVPVLPTEPVGVGAKWQSTTQSKVSERLQVTQVTDYELVGHKGTQWTIKGTTKVTGADQEIETSKISKIGGGGTIDATIDNGALYPAFKTTTETSFTASDKDKSVTFTLKVSGTVTLKDGPVPMVPPPAPGAGGPGGPPPGTPGGPPAPPPHK